MKINEKILHSQSNEIRIYKEGVFWMAYEQSAYWFHLQKSYKPTKKFVKTVSQDVVSIGFPSSALKGLETLYKFTEDTDRIKVWLPEQEIDRSEFEVWKNALPVYEKTEGSGVPLPSVERAHAPSQQLVEKLRSFDLSNATPMQCMLFLSEVKKEL